MPEKSTPLKQRAPRKREGSQIKGKSLLPSRSSSDESKDNISLKIEPCEAESASLEGERHGVLNSAHTASHTDEDASLLEEIHRTEREMDSALERTRAMERQLPLSVSRGFVVSLALSFLLLALYLRVFSSVEQALQSVYSDIPERSLSQSVDSYKQGQYYYRRKERRSSIVPFLSLDITFPPPVSQEKGTINGESSNGPIVETVLSPFLNNLDLAWQLRGQELYTITQPDLYEDFSASPNLETRALLGRFPHSQRCLRVGVQIKRGFSADIFSFTTEKKEFFIRLPIPGKELRMSAPLLELFPAFPLNASLAYFAEVVAEPGTCLTAEALPALPAYSTAPQAFESDAFLPITLREDVVVSEERLFYFLAMDGELSRLATQNPSLDALQSTLAKQVDEQMVSEVQSPSSEQAQQHIEQQQESRRISNPSGVPSNGRSPEHYTPPSHMDLTAALEEKKKKRIEAINFAESLEVETFYMLKAVTIVSPKRESVLRWEDGADNTLFLQFTVPSILSFMIPHIHLEMQINDMTYDITDLLKAEGKIAQNRNISQRVAFDVITRITCRDRTQDLRLSEIEASVILSRVLFAQAPPDVVVNGMEGSFDIELRDMIPETIYFIHLEMTLTLEGYWREEDAGCDFSPTAPVRARQESMDSPNSKRCLARRVIGFDGVRIQWTKN